jgi:hypothetical protein
MNKICLICKKPVEDTMHNFHYFCLSVKDKEKMKPINKKPKIKKVVKEPVIIKVSYNKNDTTLYL